jgi:PAS domain S-box-containing protein
MAQRKENSKKLRQRAARSKPDRNSLNSQTSGPSSRRQQSHSQSRSRRQRLQLAHGETPARQAIADLLAHTQEIANVGSWEYDTADKTFLWSEHMYRMLGLEPRAEPVPLSLACSHFHPDDRARVWNDVAALLETGQPIENEVRFISAEGKVRVFFSRAIPIADQAGKVALIRGISQDVTNRKDADEKLRKSEALLAQAEQIANLGSWEVAADGASVTWSDNLYRIFQRENSGRPLLLEDLWKQASPDNVELPKRDLHLALTQGVAYEHEVPYPLPNGQIRTLLSRGLPIRQSDGTISRVVGVTQDVTQQREAQKTRHETEEHFRFLVNSLKDYAIFTLDCDGNVTSWNRGAEMIHGYKPEEILGQHFSLLFPPEDIASERPIRELQQALGNGRYEDESWRVRKDGSLFWADVLLAPIRDDDGNLKGFAKITRDTTDRRKTEEELRKRQALLVQAEMLANMGSWEIDTASRTITWSDQLFRMLSLDPPSRPAALEDFWKLVKWEDLEESSQAVAKAIQTRQRFDHIASYKSPGGQTRILHSRGIPITDNLGHTIRLIGTTQDITERKLVEEKLRKSEALLARAETLANLGSWELDLRTGEVSWSAQLFRILGVDPEQTPPDLDLFSELTQLGNRESILHESRSAPDVPFQAEVRWRLPDGTTKILHSRALPAYSETGEPLRLIGTTEDITERRHHEDILRRLSQQLLNVRDEEQRRVARDLHESVVQSMAAMKMLLGLVGDSVPPADERARKLIHSATELTNETMSQVRTISHLLHPPLLDEAGLYPALRWYARGFAERSGIATKVEMDENFDRLPQETELAIFRIVQEALTNIHRHSSSQDATIRIFRDSEKVRVEVEDHGRGMALPSPAAAKEVQLGVGTAGMRERVIQLNGTFEIKSEPGRGTIVCAALPLARAEREISGSPQENTR